MIKDIANDTIPSEKLMEFSTEFLTKLAKVRMMCDYINNLIKSWHGDSIPLIVLPVNEYAEFKKAVGKLVPYGIDTDVFFEPEIRTIMCQQGIFGRFLGLYPVMVKKDIRKILVVENTEGKGTEL